MGDFAGAVLKYVRRHPVDRLTLCGGFAKLSKLAAGHLDLHSARSQVDKDLLGRPRPRGRRRRRPGRGAWPRANTGLAALRLCEAAGHPAGRPVAARARDEALSVLRGAPRGGRRDLHRPRGGDRGPRRDSLRAGGRLRARRRRPPPKRTSCERVPGTDVMATGVMAPIPVGAAAAAADGAPPPSGMPARPQALMPLMPLRTARWTARSPVAPAPRVCTEGSVGRSRGPRPPRPERRRSRRSSPDRR